MLCKFGQGKASYSKVQRDDAGMALLGENRSDMTRRSRLGEVLSSELGRDDARSVAA